MKNPKRLVFVIVLLLMAGTVGALKWFAGHQRVGQPGIKATPTRDSLVMQIDLPEKVLDFISTNLPEDQTTLSYLPKDTSFARRRYVAPDGLPIDGNIILMGSDRSSIHKADYCLAGAGFTTDRKETTRVALEGPRPAELTVAKWTVSRTVEVPGGEKRREHGLYVFWFVAEGESTPSYFAYKCRLMWGLLRTATLQRWAYINYFVPCAPGQEDAAFERLSKLIAASVPEFVILPDSAPVSRPAGP